MCPGPGACVVGVISLFTLPCVLDDLKRAVGDPLGRAGRSAAPAPALGGEAAAASREGRAASPIHSNAGLLRPLPPRELMRNAAPAQVRVPVTGRPGGDGLWGKVVNEEPAGELLGAGAPLPSAPHGRRRAPHLPRRTVHVNQPRVL